MNWQFWLRHRPLPPPTGADACNRIRPLLSLMGDGMASAKEVRAAEAHLQTCSDCQQAQLWIEATRQAIATRPVVLPPADMRARIALAIAASAETALPAVPIASPAARRTFVVRPAYAAAASLAVAGAFLGHYLLTAGPVPSDGGSAPPSKRVPLGQGQTGQSAPASQARADHQPLAQHSVKNPVMATVPLNPASTPTEAHGLLMHPGRLSKAPSASPADPGVDSQPILTSQLPAHHPAITQPHYSSLVAIGPSVKTPSRVEPSRGSSAPQIALLPPRPVDIPNNSAPAQAVMPSAPVSTPPSATVVARLPDTAPAMRSRPGDALGSIRLSLASYRSTDYAHRLSMASGVHERQNFVQGPIAYTPTSLSEDQNVRRVAASSPRPAVARTLIPAAAPVPDTVLPATDQRRSEREKQWSDIPATGGA